MSSSFLFRGWRFHSIFHIPESSTINLHAEPTMFNACLALLEQTEVATSLEVVS